MEKVANGIWKLKIGEPEKFTPVKTVKTSIKDTVKDLPSSGIAPFKDLDIKVKSTPRGCLVELPFEPDEKIYGFGLQLKKVNHTGRKEYLRVNSDPISDTGDSHAPVPFYVSTKGYGIYVDTARFVTFYCAAYSKKGSNDGAKNERKTDVADNTTDLYRTDKILKNTSVFIEIPCAKGVDIYFFEGPDMKNAVQRYNLFSGGGCIPPYWGLGVWYRAYGKADMAHVLKLARQLRKSDVPCDVLGIEPGWQSHSYSCSYKWDKIRFPKPDKMLKEMKDLNFKVNLWEHSYVHPSSDIYDDLKEYSGDFEVWGGLVPDFSLDDTRKIFGEYHGENFVDKGISGFKLDECDGADYNISNWAFPECSQFPSGMDGEQMHSLFGMLYQKTLFSEFRKRNKRTYSEVRSSHALASSMPFVLYSDLYDHKDFIRGVVNMGFSGLLWSPEVRDCKSDEDLIRRLQSVVLSPQALINAWTIPNPPWTGLDEKIQRICKDILKLRMKLIPYLYTSFASYYFKGIPPFRALVMDCPDDENTFDIEDEYMMGDSLLVAPFVCDEKDRYIYLPEGVWYDFYTKKRYNGGEKYSIVGQLERIPVFVKGGTVLPLAEPVSYIEKDICFKIHLECYGDGCIETSLYEDDGETFDYEKGIYNIVNVKILKDGKINISRKGNYNKIRYIFE